MVRPPGPKGQPLLGSAPAFMTDTLNFLESLRDYGDVAHFRFAWHRDYLVNTPALIREVLISKADHFSKTALFKRASSQPTLFTSDGEFWRRQRKLMQPAFHTGRIGAYADTMRDYTLELAQTWQPGETRLINREMSELALRIFAKALFDAEMEDESYDAARALDTLAGQFGAFVAGGFLPRWLPTPNNRAVKEAEVTLRRILTAMIRERRASGEDRGDLLSVMMFTTYEDGTKMSDEGLYAEVNAMFFAGQEANAGMIAWALYLLSQHPQLAQKLYDEVDEVLAGRPVRLADLSQLNYTDRWIKETLRLYPLAYAFSRDVVREVELGGYTLPVGASVHVSPWALHRNPEIWNDPLRFDPERFHPERGAAHGKYDYLPFGGGPRVCIGNHFALMEAKVVLVTLAQHFRLELAPGYTVTPERQFTVYPSGGLPMMVRAR